MAETCWEEVVAALMAILEEISPEVRDLITPPQRLSGTPSFHPQPPSPQLPGPRSEVTPAGTPASGSSPDVGSSFLLSGGSSSSLSQQQQHAPRTFTLREGVGARRLAKFRCQAATQLLLVQGCSELYAKTSTQLPPSAVRGLLDSLAAIYRHAHSADMDMDLRRRLAIQQVCGWHEWAGGM